MKKIIAILLLLCLFVPCASADARDDFKAQYSTVAKVFGAPPVFTSNRYDNGIQIKLSNDLFIRASMNASGKVDTVGVYCNSTAEEGNFLAACMAVMAAFNDVDMDGYGILLNQFSKIKAGKANDSPYITKAYNYFSVRTNAESKYIFVYILMG